MKDAPLGRIRMNRIRDDLVTEYLRLRDYYIDLLMADGAPPFTDPIPEPEQLQRLVAWRDLGDPRYWQSPAAQHRLRQLAGKYCGPPDVAPQTMRPEEVFAA